jgi:hypothetical protein
MFGHPIAPEAQVIGVPREIEGIAQGLCGRGIRGNGGKIENGQWDHGEEAHTNM